MIKKHIGIPAYLSSGMFGMNEAYMQYLSEFGGVHLITPDDGVLEKLDLLILPGGRDIDTMRYNQKPGYTLGNPNPWFEWFDTVMLPRYIKAGVPIFGICRGLQTLNIHFGGTLEQNIIDHPTSGARDELVHTVMHPSQKKSGNKDMEVNSLHHQSVAILGENLQVLLVSDEDHQVEAIRHLTLPISAVQWHPEEIRDDYSNKEITRLLNITR